jgi:chromosome transmission fidelity protein 4
MYSITNIARDEAHQDNDVVALPPYATISSVFFSDAGDPYIYDSTGVLLVLLHWRVPGQATWVPVLDTTQLARLASGRKEEHYWPVAVADGRFHCIILKGGERYPYFPRPLLSEFAFEVPLGTRAVGSADKGEGDSAGAGGEAEASRLEESFVRTSLCHDLLEDKVGSSQPSYQMKTELARLATEVDKALLQLMATECREGEEKGMKALQLVGMMKDTSGKMLEAAVKVAQRYERSVLEGKIRDLAERRLMGIEEEDRME